MNITINTTNRNHLVISDGVTASRFEISVVDATDHKPGEFLVEFWNAAGDCDSDNDKWFPTDANGREALSFFLCDELDSNNVLRDTATLAPLLLNILRAAYFEADNN